MSSTTSTLVSKQRREKNQNETIHSDHDDDFEDVNVIVIATGKKQIIRMKKGRTKKLNGHLVLHVSENNKMTEIERLKERMKIMQAEHEAELNAVQKQRAR